MYRIKQYTLQRAKQLRLTVKPSRRKNKKIDVFKLGELVASIGDIRYKDYPTYLELEKKGKVPKGTAKKRRELYKKRHVNRLEKNSPSWYADNLLW